jgi:hypothetical protein
MSGEFKSQKEVPSRACVGGHAAATVVLPQSRRMLEAGLQW